MCFVIVSAIQATSSSERNMHACYRLDTIKARWTLQIFAYFHFFRTFRILWIDFILGRRHVSFSPHRWFSHGQGAHTRSEKWVAAEGLMHLPILYRSLGRVRSHPWNTLIVSHSVLAIREIFFHSLEIGFSDRFFLGWCATHRSFFNFRFCSPLRIVRGKNALCFAF